MRLKKDYLAIVRNFFEWSLSRFKPFVVHTEAIMIDSVWEKIQEMVENNSVKKWYIMTPENFLLYKSSFNMKMSKGELSEIMKKRYRWMIERKQELELHVHLSLTMKTMTYNEQEEIIGNSIKWMKEELGVAPREFVPGWWSFDKNTMRVLKKYNLKMIYSRDYDYGHDYEWIIK